MGYQVAFWSPYHGQTRNTSNAIITSTYTAVNHSLKVLLAHSQYTRSNLESAFMDGTENISLVDFEDIGIDSLQRLANSSQLTIEDIRNYTKTLIIDRLDMLPGTTKTKEDLFENIEETIPYILHCTKNAYDIVFIDVNSGMYNPITKKILNDCDLIIVSLNQNIKVLNDYFNKAYWNSSLDNKKIILVLSEYDKKSTYTANYIKKLYKYDDEIFTIPYSSHFRDSHNDHTVLDFFYANNEVDKNDTEYDFINSVDKLTTKILENLEVDIQYTRKSLFKKKLSFFNIF